MYHSAEPWSIENDRIVAANGSFIDDSDKPRIVACVNLLAGIPRQLLVNAMADPFAMDQVLQRLIDRSTLALVDPQEH